MSTATDIKLAEICGYEFYDTMFPRDPVYPHVCRDHQVIGLSLWFEDGRYMFWSPSTSWNSLMFALKQIQSKWNSSQQYEFSRKLSHLLGGDRKVLFAGGVMTRLVERGPEVVCRAILEVE